MVEEEPIQGVSFRNTKRHWKKKYGPVGKDGPRLPTYPAVEVKDPQAHVHPRRYRDELCGCGYPARPCSFLDDDTRNYCYKEHSNDDASETRDRTVRGRVEGL